MDSLFAFCRVCVSTIDAGSGIKVRVSEALRRGRPVVATPHSCVGYEAIDSQVLQVSEIEGMMDAIESVLSSGRPGDLERLSRSEFDAKLSFEAGSRMISDVLERVERSVQPPHL
jgi:glycosyltransferase involved in cell wall biosynthesis